MLKTKNLGASKNAKNQIKSQPPTGAKRSGATVWFVKIEGMDWLWKRRGRVRLENAKRFPLFPNAAAAGILS
jgi:hypothetical protein